MESFPSSIVGVPTAVPAFIGYTQKTNRGEPVQIASLADFESIFGAGFTARYDIQETQSKTDWDIQVGSTFYQLTPASSAQFFLYECMRLFFDNGGGNCYVVSVGDYSGMVSEAALRRGLDAIRNQVGPTMLVIPEAMLLGDGGAFQNIVQAMLAQCGELQDRVAILDVFGAHTVNKANVDTALEPLIASFQNYVGSNALSYGMAYFPILNTSVAGADDVNFTWFADTAQLQQLLGQAADQIYGARNDSRATVQAYIDQIPKAATPQEILTLNQSLNKVIPPYVEWQEVILANTNLLPPSAGMAGIFALTDYSKGVWNAPANVTMNSVLSVSVKLSDEQQGKLNVPLNGKAVNAIRDFPGRGPVVWGARTLDGNSNDYRYIQVRRTIIYIEQSIKTALNQFTFAPNDGRTWVAVMAMISNFLQGLWSQGALMGDKASDAYTVQCGLGSTMTAQDILDGYMVVQATQHMIRPAEFIELTFKQKMQGAT